MRPYGQQITQSYVEYILMTVFAVNGSENIYGVFNIWSVSSVCHGRISWVCVTHSCVGILWNYAVSGTLMIYYIHSNIEPPLYSPARECCVQCSGYNYYNSTRLIYAVLFYLLADVCSMTVCLQARFGLQKRWTGTPCHPSHWWR